MSPDGVITTVAGNGTFANWTPGPGPSEGDGGPATAVALSYPRRVAVGADGSVYIAEWNNARVRRVSPDGIITTVVGNGTWGLEGDGGPAVDAQIYSLGDVAVSPDGSIYITDYNRVRRVGPDGIITTVAGTGEQGFSGDGILATAAQLSFPSGVAVGPGGVLYIADSWNSRVRRVGSDGIITTLAGNGTDVFSGDGGPATEAAVPFPFALAVAPDGSLYISDISQRVRRVGPDGIITTVAGTGNGAFSGDRGPPTAAGIDVYGVAVGPDGTLYVADFTNHRIRAIRSTLPDLGTGEVLVAAADGGEVYQFDAQPECGTRSR